MAKSKRTVKSKHQHVNLESILSAHKDATGTCDWVAVNDDNFQWMPDNSVDLVLTARERKPRPLGRGKRVSTFSTDYE